MQLPPPREVAGYLCIPTLRQWTHSSAVVKLDESTLYVQSLHLALEPFPFVSASEFSCHITSSHILHCFLPKAPSASPADCLPQRLIPQLFPMSCQQHYHCSLLYYSSSFTGIFYRLKCFCFFNLPPSQPKQLATCPSNILIVLFLISLLSNQLLDSSYFSIFYSTSCLH